MKDLFAQRLLEVLKDRKIKRVELAEKLKISTSSMQRYTSGESKPNHEFFLAICKEGINVNWLLTGEGEMYRSKAQQQMLSDPANDDDSFMPLLRWLYKRFDARDRATVESVMKHLEQQDNDKDKR